MKDQSRNTARRKGRPRRPRFLTALLIFALISALTVNVVCAVTLFGTKVTNNTSAGESQDPRELLKEELTEKREAQNARTRSQDTSARTIVPERARDLSQIVTNEGDLLSALNSASGKSGIDFENEYRVETVRTYENVTLYRIHQYYDGIPVEGYTMNVSVNASGEINYTSGKHADLSGFSAETQIGESEARDLAGKYLKLTYQMDPDSLRLTTSGLSILCPEGEAPAAGYTVLVYNGNDILFRRLFVDGNTRQVIADQSGFSFEQITRTLSGALGDQKVDVEKTGDKSYRLLDTGRNLDVLDAEGRSVEQAASDGVDTIEWTEDGMFRLSDSAVDALGNISKAYDFYQNYFGRIGTTNSENGPALQLVVDVSSAGGMNMTDNAAMSADADLLVVGPASSGKVPASAYLDVMAHEFTHGVLSSEANLTSSINSPQMNAMNEGLADVFGELTEDYYDNGTMDGSCSWETTGYRDASTSAGKSVTVASDFNDQSTDPHDGGYIVSHAAYLMAHGVNGDGSRQIGTESLAYLLYDLFPMLSPQSGFSEFRSQLEILSYFPGPSGCILTDQQREGLIDSLDAVGIQPSYDYCLIPGAELLIYDINMDLYQNAAVTIDTFNGRNIVTDAAAPAGKFSLTGITPGIYQVTVSDHESDGTVSFTMIINDDGGAQSPVRYQTEGDVFTSFGAAGGNVVLVLDVSGSMDGTPITQVRAAAENFARTIEESAPRVHIDVVTYDSGSRILTDEDTTPAEVADIARSLYSGGGTNIYDALTDARSLLAGKERRAIVLMSDGLPNEGRNDNGDYEAPLRALSGEIRNEGTFIYTFGFFHVLTGEELVAGENLMAAIANDGYSTNVTTAGSSEVEAVFQYIAYQISHVGETIHIEAHCPVNIKVRYNDQELSSEEGGCRQTDFGLLTFEGENNEVKILNLKKGPDYEVIIDGYDKGTMDYSISYADKDGNYTDVRTFEKIPIQKGTFITTGTSSAAATELSVDEDGDGSIDTVYSADKGSRARTVSFLSGRKLTLILLIATGLFLAAYGLLALVSFLKRRPRGISSSVFEGPAASSGRSTATAPAFCRKCGAPLGGNAFCRKCGTPAGKKPAELLRPAVKPLTTPSGSSGAGSSGRNVPGHGTAATPGVRPVRPVFIQNQSGQPAPSAAGARPVRQVPPPRPYVVPGKRRKAPVILKLVFTALLALDIIAVLFIYGSPATSVYQRLTDHQYVTANYVYEHRVEESAVSRGYLSFLTSHYITKAENAYEAGSISGQTLKDLLDTVSAMDMGGASERAKDILAEKSF